MVDWSVQFDVAFAIDPGVEPSGGDWVDLSTRLHAGAPVDIQSGAGRLAMGAQGSATLLLDNTDRAIDPTNEAATYNLAPLRHARIRATIGATTYPLFRGYVDAWPPTWSSFDSVVTVRLVDAFAWLALQDADLDLPVQMSHERITALLDLAGWPVGLRDIADGVVELEEYEQHSANLLRSMQDASDAEGGDLYVAPDGKITFRSRHARFDSTPVLTFGEGGVAFSASTPAWDAVRLTNIARVELADGEVYEVIDDTSVDDHGPRVMPTRDLALRPAEAQSVAQWEVYRFKDQHLWVDALTIESSETGALASVLPLRIGDLTPIAHTPPAGDPVAVDMCVERWHHQIGADLWTVGFDLSPYFGEGPWLILDDLVRGLLDEDNVFAP